MGDINCLGFKASEVRTSVSWHVGQGVAVVVYVRDILYIVSGKDSCGCWAP